MPADTHTPRSPMRSTLQPKFGCGQCVQLMHFYMGKQTRRMQPWPTLVSRQHPQLRPLDSHHTSEPPHTPLPLHIPRKSWPLLRSKLSQCRRHVHGIIQDAFCSYHDERVLCMKVIGLHANRHDWGDAVAGRHTSRSSECRSFSVCSAATPSASISRTFSRRSCSRVSVAIYTSHMHTSQRPRLRCSQDSQMQHTCMHAPAVLDWTRSHARLLLVTAPLGRNTTARGVHRSLHTGLLSLSARSGLVSLSDRSASRHTSPHLLKGKRLGGARRGDLVEAGIVAAGAHSEAREGGELGEGTPALGAHARDALQAECSQLARARQRP